MKRMMKFFVSLLVVAMVVVLMPVQQVSAEEDYFIYIPDSSVHYGKDGFVELTDNMYLLYEDGYGVNHEFYPAYFKESENEGKAILAFLYVCEKLENKADVLIMETLTHSGGSYVKAYEQAYWELIGYDSVYLEFEYDKEAYNDPYLYFFIGVGDTKTGELTQYDKMKIKNDFYVIHLEKIEIPNKEDVVVGGSEKLNVTYVPADTMDDKTIIWSSSDESIATVDSNGVVTGVSVGSVTITAEASNGYKDTCVVDVKKEISAMSFEKDVYEVNHPDSIDLQLKFLEDEGANANRIFWKIEDETLASFGEFDYENNSMSLSTLAPGVTRVTATSENGVSASCEIRIDAPIRSVDLKGFNGYLYIGDTFDLNTLVTIYPENTNYDKTLTWTSSEEGRATIDENGIITGIASGLTKVTVKTSNGKTDVIDVVVREHTMIDKIEMSPDSVQLFVGNQISFKDKVWVVPSDATIDKTLRWTSNNESVVTVDENGVITAVAVGKASIVISSVNGKTATVEVVVTDGVDRIFGANRYETAFKVADTLKSTLGVDQFKNVIVANGTNFADALAGSYLSSEKEAPILMTDKSSKNINTLVEYIENNVSKSGTVYILGGTAAVSNQVDELLKNKGYYVKRLAGANRYETNMKIIQEGNFVRYDGELLVCTGTNFADSLSVSATGLPIMLVGNSKLTKEQEAFIKNSDLKQVTFVGGYNAVSSELEMYVFDLLSKRENATYPACVGRLAGENRYETSVKVGNTYFNNTNNAVLAYAQNYPDGLSGGALAHALNAPLLLTDGKVKNYTVTSEFTNTRNIVDGYVLGGNTLVTDEAVQKIFGNNE